MCKLDFKTSVSIDYQQSRLAEATEASARAEVEVQYLEWIWLG